MRESRRALGITQERLGGLLGITFQQIQKYEKAVSRISIGRLILICEALAVSLAAITQAEHELSD